MSHFTFQRYTNWRHATSTARIASSFRVGYVETRDLLRYELEKLKARNAIVEVGAKEFISGGMPRQKTIWHPGVILSFNCAQGQLVYPAERFTDWRDNLRAIALALEALRKVDRYGITQGGEQYAGWKALPESSQPPSMPDSIMGSDLGDFHSAEEAGVWLSTIIGDQSFGALGTSGEKKRAYQTAAKLLHPDNGGEAFLFRRLQKAKELLGI